MAKEHGGLERNPRFSVRHSGEIELILRGLMESKALVTLQASDARAFLITTIVSIDTQAGVIYLGAGDEAEKNAALLNAPAVAFSSFHERIKVHFESAALELVTVDGQSLLRIPLPAELQRFQRREYFRIQTSLTNPVKCLIPTPQGTVDAAVIDISVGGIGILAYEQAVPVTAGEAYHGCQLSLPGGGAYLVSLNVRSTYDVTLKNGALSHRAGCQFINLAVSIESEIQRYIFQLERNRRFHT